MNTIHRNTYSDAPKPRMKGPPKLKPLMDDMLEKIKETPNLAEQSTLFTLDQQLGNTSSRWIFADSVMQQPWILWRESGDEIQTLLVMSNVVRRILVFESKNGVQWQRERAVEFSEADSVVPKPHRHTSWMSKAASGKQMDLIAEVTNTPKHELPRISIYNVSALIHVRRMTLQAHAIEYMVRCWEYDIENSYGKQEILFPCIERIE